MSRKNRKAFHITAIIILLALIILLLIGIYLIKLSNDLNVVTINKQALSAQPEISSEIKNIALFGVDMRNGQSGDARSDAIIIASVNKADNTISLSSILRDTAVEIEGYGTGKINSAYKRGGAELAIKTINQNFGLDITDYITVNFASMAEIIDAVGGIEITLTEAEVADANNSIYEQANVAGLPKDIIKSAGKQTLSGTQAVAYARIRYVKTSEGEHDDFGRTDRQREVIDATLAKIKQNGVFSYPSMASSLLPALETSLEFSEIISLSRVMLHKFEVLQQRFPERSALIGDGTIYIGSEQCLNADLNSTKEAIYRFIYH